MRNQGLFLVFILCLTLGLSWASSIFRDHYSDRKDLQAEISKLHHGEEKQALKQALLENQLEEMRSHVFQTLDQKSSLAWSEKQWWAGLRGPASENPLKPRTAGVFANAKKEFRAKNYAASAEKFRKFIDQYPTSADVVEAHFLLAESLFLSGQPEASLDLIDQMMLRYPDSELTGFIMLRMGQIFEGKNRPEDAREVYETILRQFPQSAALKTQADRLMRAPASL